MPLPARLRPIDARITAWLARHGVNLTRVSLGVVFFWFGALKFFSGWSAAEDLASRTIEEISFGLVPGSIGVRILAVWETLIGLGLLSGKFLRVTLLLLAVQMIGALLPLFLFPGRTFVTFPVAPTLEGQYIIKNIVLISAAMVVGATVRGGHMVPRKTPHAT